MIHQNLMIKEKNKKTRFSNECIKECMIYEIDEFTDEELEFLKDIIKNNNPNKLYLDIHNSKFLLKLYKSIKETIPYCILPYKNKCIEVLNELD